MKKLFIDFETRSLLDIKKCGAWRYAMHPSTEVLCAAAYPSDWTGGVPLVIAGHDISAGTSVDLADMLRHAEVVVAHNAHFEYAIWNYILHKRYGWPSLWEPSRWSCTLSRAAMSNLPISLDKACKALNVPHQKQTLKGRSAMQRLCKPKGYNVLGDPIWDNDPATLHDLYEYCRADVAAEMDLDSRLPELPPQERKIWELDLRINHRGFLSDVYTASKAKDMAEEITNALNGKLLALTNGQVDRATRVQSMKYWLESKGLKVSSLNKEAVTNLLKNPVIPQEVKDVIAIRQQVGKSSTAKYQAILDTAGEDKRIRGTLQYHAAGTGRWGGRLVQPQNLPKGTIKDCTPYINAIARGDKGGLGDKPMEALSSCIRGVMCIAPKGRKLVVADYSAIEARVLLWLANDELGLGKYRMGINLYVDMAKFIYNDSEIAKDTHPKEYALGKAAVLGCGYGMGKDKFVATCASQGIDINIELAEKAISAYRKKYKRVVEMWYAVEAAAKNAVLLPGTVHACCDGKAVFGMDPKREYLVCKLPSGRHLRYFRPSVKAIETAFGEKQEIHYYASDMAGDLEEFKTYGGSLVENITQATARDIMASGMLNAEAAGYKIILTVHDELVAETEDDKRFNVDGFVKTMCTLPPWAAGCPIAAEGWEGYRYRK